MRRRLLLLAPLVAIMIGGAVLAGTAAADPVVPVDPAVPAAPALPADPGVAVPALPADPVTTTTAAALPADPAPPTSAAPVPVSSPAPAPVATASPKPSKPYTVTNTFGPFNGAARPGQPGAAPADGLLASFCGPHESVVGASTKINHKTSHGTTKKDVLTLDVIGVFYDGNRGDLALGVGAYARPTGKAGWNTVTVTATCRR